ncbi:MAG: Na/Pi cotransporter family protein [bacterium]
MLEEQTNLHVVFIMGSLLGGLGLFLLAVTMITDGLKLAAGDALRDILTRSTQTPLRGVVSGILMTSLVQSSSAVTVATIGFVNAGLLNLMQALGIVYGANIGTTMTAWLVAAVGFEFKIELFALPMIGLGMAMRLVGASKRIGALGEAIAGFGLFFIGIDVLREAFQGFAAGMDLTTLSSDSTLGLLLYVLAGFMATLLTQSSSAAIAITLTAATGGVLALDAAAAMVIGANVGTTSTAALSVIGATSNAKRVAAAHVIFNVVTGVVALLLLPVLLKIVAWTSETFGMQAMVAVNLAIFHTVFNILGVAIMWSYTQQLARFLQGRFKTVAEQLGQPVHLDRNVMVSPALALDALRLELRRMAELSQQHAIAAIKGAATSEIDHLRVALESLNEGVESFVNQLERERLGEATAVELSAVLRINNYLAEVGTLAEEIAAQRADLQRIRDSAAGETCEQYLASILALLRACDLSAESIDPQHLDSQYNALRKQWHDLKSTLLQKATLGQLPLSGLNSALELLRSALRIAEQSTKVATRLHRTEPEEKPAVATPG